MGRQSSRKQIRIPRLIRAAAEETLRQNDAIEAILLYGSRARGDHRRGSDYDIAVISNLPRMEAYEAAKALYDKELEKRYWTELAFTSPEDLARYPNTAGTLESRLAREGILIAGEWTRPECREGWELDIDAEKALDWVRVAMGNGLQATMWLSTASSENWSGDNEAATRIERMAGLVTKGIVATFGIHESDIHDLDRTAEELANAYADTGWRRAERAAFAVRIRALKSKGRAALRAEKRKGTFEPLDETIGRLGRIWSLMMQWLETVAELHPETGKQVGDIAKKVDVYLTGSDEDEWDRGISAELIRHARETREAAQRLGAKLDKG